MTLEAIKEAISELPATEQTYLADWLYTQEAEGWNRQIETDFSDGGRGIPLVALWDAEIQAGGSVSARAVLNRSPRLI